MAHLKSLINGVLLWVLVLAPAGAWAERPLVLLSTAGNSYATLLGALQRHYQHPLESRILSTDTQPETESRLIIAIGSQACASALEAMGSSSRLFCLYLPAQTFERLTDNPRGRTLLAENRLSALFLDQPLSRQMHLAKLIHPEMKRIGTVLGPGNPAQEAHFRNTAQRLGLKAVIGHLYSDDNPVRILTPVIANSDLFLPLPDHSVFNRAAAKWMLYITLRKGVPLLGFSAKYADAGAAVALYSDTEGLARQAAQMLDQSKDRLPPPSWPNDFNISINGIAARNLGLTLPPAGHLVELLKTREGL